LHVFAVHSSSVADPLLNVSSFEIWQFWGVLIFVHNSSTWDLCPIFACCVLHVYSCVRFGAVCARRQRQIIQRVWGILACANRGSFDLKFRTLSLRSLNFCLMFQSIRISAHMYFCARLGTVAGIWHPSALAFHILVRCHLTLLCAGMLGICGLAFDTLARKHWRLLCACIFVWNHLTYAFCVQTFDL